MLESIKDGMGWVDLSMGIYGTAKKWYRARGTNVALQEPHDN